MLPGDHQTTRSPDLCTPAHLSQGRLGVCKLNNGHHLAAGQDHGETADSLTSSAAAAAMAWELYPCTFPGGVVMPKAMGAEKHLDTALVGMSLKDVRKAPKRPWKYRGFNS